MEPVCAMKNGWIEVICGPMYAGKSEELIRRVKRAQIARQKSIVIKPKLDSRYHDNDVVSHNGVSYRAVSVKSIFDVAEMYASTPDVQIIAIDEAQFFEADIVNIAEYFSGKGLRVIIAGLDLDYLGKPFGAMPQLLAVADFVTKLNAVCVECGEIATRTYRIPRPTGELDPGLILIGSTDRYQARCKSCHKLR